MKGCTDTRWYEKPIAGHFMSVVWVFDQRRRRLTIVHIESNVLDDPNAIPRKAAA